MSTPISIPLREAGLVLEPAIPGFLADGELPLRVEDNAAPADGACSAPLARPDAPKSWLREILGEEPPTT